MSYTHRLTNMYPSTSSTSHSSATASGSAGNNSSTLRQSSQSQSLLQTRIASKRTELENLRALRDLSANLATQLATLEEKLGTLKDGAQSVALVLANWENVLRAINMAAMKVPKPPEEGEGDDADIAGANPGRRVNSQSTPELPVPLVRIPIQPKTEEIG
ncbi:hypothetical protein A1O3_06346 [Capronia epimyces CBS 606.96]|uniref:DASH complex subunit DAD2 n=1 Tax=Capronia epimyces CBS 606.96 TaxID=1182542 RepID=W9XQN8_9EURO|nr:uncharacterized protein A1O3_06346 [Capronia epimyces CBS 606.96]EXJ82533.1 hypothetical protein A1O3_06346 [Capronia epimyces CBS 606.96]